jgi:hypothetical protein
MIKKFINCGIDETLINCGIVQTLINRGIDEKLIYCGIDEMWFKYAWNRYISPELL